MGEMRVDNTRQKRESEREMRLQAGFWRQDIPSTVRDKFFHNQTSRGRTVYGKATILNSICTLPLQFLTFHYTII